MSLLRTVICGVAVAGMALSAFAQDKKPTEAPAGQPGAKAPGERGPGPGGPGGPGARPQLSPEAAKAAWSLQATGVAKRLGVDDSKTAAVVSAYTAARESQAAEGEKIRKDLAEKARKAGEDAPRGMGGEMMEAMENLNKTEREKLEKSLAASLTAEQVKKATTSLGTFNRQWDNMADAVVGFKLESAKQQDACNAMEDFVVSQVEIRAKADDGDREAMRAAMQESRQKLLDSMKKVLSEEQMKKFETTMMGGRMRGGDRGGRPDGGT